MQYLTLWRMQIAARLLADGSMKMAAVGREIGYRSEAAFSRAFKKIVGLSPAAWRDSTIGSIDLKVADWACCAKRRVSAAGRVTQFHPGCGAGRSFAVQSEPNPLAGDRAPSGLHCISQQPIFVLRGGAEDGRAVRSRWS
jgi:hypothetical protein